MVRGVGLALGAAAVLGTVGARPGGGNQEAALTFAPDDKHRLGPLLLAAGGTHPRGGTKEVDGNGGEDASAGLFDGNPLAGGCTATVEEFVARYGQRQGFRNFINTQIGEFSECLQDIPDSGGVPHGALRSGGRGRAQAPPVLLSANASKAERLAAARTAAGKAADAKQKHDAFVARQQELHGREGGEGERESEGEGGGGSRHGSGSGRGGGGRGRGGGGKGRGRGSGGRGGRGRGGGGGGGGGGGSDGGAEGTEVPDAVVEKVRERIASFNQTKSASDYFGIHAWKVEATPRDVAGAGFQETLFGVALDVEDTDLAAELETVAGAEAGFAPVPFARVIERRAHRIRTSAIHGQYNQWFQAPAVWDSLNRAVKYRPGDIIVATHPKAGTTWTEQIVLLLLAGGDESKVSARRRHMPSFTEKYMLDGDNFFKLWFERDLGKFHQSDEITQHKLQLMNKMPGRRVIKTHAYRRNLLGNNLFGGGEDVATQMDSQQLDDDGGDDAAAAQPDFDPNTKVIYVARNPKDQAMSMFHQEFHFGTLENEVPWPLDAWLKAWFNGVNVYGSWFVSLKGWFEALVRDQKGQLLFLKYEDMIHDHAGAVRKIAAHLGLDAADDRLVAAVVEKSRMEHIKDELKGKGSKGVIYRKGGIGDWRNTFSPALSAEFDARWQREMQQRGLCGRGRPELQFDVGDGQVLQC